MTTQTGKGQEGFNMQYHDLGACYSRILDLCWIVSQNRCYDSSESCTFKEQGRLSSLETYAFAFDILSFMSQKTTSLL